MRLALLCCRSCDRPQHNAAPQSRRCHLPNNQIVKDHATGIRRAAGVNPPSTTFPIAPASVWAGTKNENARVVVPGSHPASGVPHAFHSLMGKRLSIELSQRGRQLGVRILESSQKSQRLSFFPLSDYPSSKVKYTGLELSDKGRERISHSVRKPPAHNDLRIRARARE